ncbi:hypothetical protein OFL53_21725, partial [Pseudomonas aeruginosa]|uniref:hypothetical protein n=1 Tax=Pseudomonas aeruginosa TaxID=287 RepID=UPI0021F1FCF0
ELEIGKPLYGGIQSLRWFLVPLLPKPLVLLEQLGDQGVLDGALAIHGKRSLLAGHATDSGSEPGG